MGMTVHTTSSLHQLRFEELKDRKNLAVARYYCSDDVLADMRMRVVTFALEIRLRAIIRDYNGKQSLTDIIKCD